VPAHGHGELGLGGGVVEALGHHVGAGEERRDVIAAEPQRVALDGHVGVDARQRGGEGVHLELPELIDEELLAVEVARLDHVEVHEDERPHAGAGQRDGERAAQPAAAGDPHPRAAHAGVHPGPVARDQQRLQLLGRGDLAAADEHHRVAREEGPVAGRREAVEDEHVGARPDVVAERVEAGAGGDHARLLVDPDGDRARHAAPSSRARA